MIKTLIASAALLALANAQAQTVSFSSASTVYTQNFDSLANTDGGSGSFVNEVTLAGWRVVRAGTTGSTTHTYGISDGSDATEGLYSYGSAGSTDRALGGRPRGPGGPNSALTYIVGFTNDTGADLPGFTLRFDGEQWRAGTSTTAQGLTFRYGYNDSTTTPQASVTLGGNFAWSSNVNTGVAGAVDGNGAGLDAGLGGTVMDTWGAGRTLWLVWGSVAPLNNAAHGLALDNVVLSAAAVPEPGNWALMLAGLGAMGFVARRRKA